MSINVVLVEPEIPQNTGNIVRTCGGIGAHLHLVKPLGFEVTDKHLKRAGLDYWHLVDITYYNNILRQKEYQYDPDELKQYFTEENVMDILKEEVGIVFTHVLEDAGVFKCTEEGRSAFRKFIAVL